MAPRVLWRGLQIHRHLRAECADPGQARDPLASNASIIMQHFMRRKDTLHGPMAQVGCFMHGCRAHATFKHGMYERVSGCPCSHVPAAEPLDHKDPAARFANNTNRPSSEAA